MYMINLMIIYDVVNTMSMKNYKSSRKLRGERELVPGRELVHHHYSNRFCVIISEDCLSGHPVNFVTLVKFVTCQP